MKKTLILLLFMISTVLSACSNGTANEVSNTATTVPTAVESATPAITEPAAIKLPRVAFVYATPIGETGYNYEMDQGRKAIEEELGVETIAMENVTESDAGRVIEQLAQEYDIIFGTTFGYMDAMVAAAEKHPDVKFMHATGYKTLPNLGTYMVREYQSNYLVGMAAGKLTKNNKLGYVGTFPIAEVISAINAYTLGAQSVNPDIEVSVVWSNTWYDPTTEKTAANSLLDYGVDVLAGYHDAPTIIQTAEAKGVWGVGKDSDMNQYAPETYLTNYVENWSPFFVETVKSMIEGTWTTGSYFGSMKDGTTDIAPFGKNVPLEVQDLVNAKKAEIIAETFDVFKGPIQDQTGTMRVPEGQSMKDADILGMDWFVKGIKGSIKN